MGAQHSGRRLWSQRRFSAGAGAQPFSDTPLQSLPCGLISFFPESALPNIPALALASGPSLFIYRNRRPYFKFTLPKVPANPLEEDVWQSIRAAPTHESGQIDPQCVDDAWKLLREIRESSTGELTNRTLLFLSMDDEISRIEFVQKVKDQPLTREPAITCIAAIKRHSKDEESMDCLIVGSEEKIVYILSPPNFTIVEKFQLSSPIVFVSARGLFQGNYTIVVVCRDGSLYRLKENACERLVQLEVQPLGLLVFEQSAIVACMNHCIYCYDYQGYRRFSILMPAAIACIEAFAHPSKRYVGYLVALENRHVRIYNGNILVSCILADGIVKAVRFGTFAREESCLVMLMTSGGLLVKRLKRSTELVSGDSVLRPPKEQNIPIPVPKKTKIFMEQSNRERDQATDLYRLFQHGLTKLRIQALKGYMQLESRSADPSGSSASLPVKLDANLLGLGPLYRLELRLENIGTEPLSNLAVHLRHSSRDIVPRCRGFQLPLLVPGLAYQLETDLHTAARDDSGGSFPNLAVPAPKLTVVVHGRGPGGPLLCAEVDLGAMACTHPPT
ncbi:ciliary BBSome complex subunit 1-domain-containing protein [Polychytrium aggregatum]|uniref:ciliary BBSome complex subunit 1-domain-containing protein n=1 Tax=Polychytrium aggregatum TaxID=110093 RepID=UPI0022FF3714|nr:ciliary BBSome complex subunit 1-domain-containing protein [Polychytrium aggregatum]KAI9207807.1 ciliary BBSome complex subunit 1-domain-containing protein [Polychytrium aggregatum]